MPTLLASAGAKGPDTFEELNARAAKGETFDCSDIGLFQLETDGDMGALDRGLRPRVIDVCTRAVGQNASQRHSIIIYD